MVTMTTVEVLPIMQGRSYPDAGDALYQAIAPLLDDTEEKITLDMSGVQGIPSMFLTMSIGRIIRERGADYLKQKVKFINVLSGDANRIRSYVEEFSVLINAGVI